MICKCAINSSSVLAMWIEVQRDHDNNDKFASNKSMWNEENKNQLWIVTWVSIAFEINIEKNHVDLWQNKCGIYNDMLFVRWCEYSRKRIIQFKQIAIFAITVIGLLYYIFIYIAKSSSFLLGSYYKNWAQNYKRNKTIWDSWLLFVFLLFFPSIQQHHPSAIYYSVI